MSIIANLISRNLYNPFSGGMEYWSIGK